MLVDDVLQYIDEGSNVLLYRQELYQEFSKNKGENSWAYVSNPKKGKTAISDIVNVLVPGRITRGLSIAELIDIISDYSKESNDRVILWIDNFERVNKRTLEYYMDLAGIGNLYLVCNIMSDDEFISPSFFDDFNFIILNSDEYSSSRARSVNVKFTLLLLLSVFTFLLFIRVQLSLVGYLVSALWFSLLMYRSFYYITR